MTSAQLHYRYTRDRGITGTFFWGGKVIFSDFFPGVKCFFPEENFHFGTPKTNFSGFEKWQEKKKSCPHFVTFPPSIFNFPPSLLQFFFFSSQFSPLFPFFLPSFFPGRSAEISLSEVSGGHSAPCPPPVTPDMGENRPGIPPHEMVSSAMGLKLGSSGFCWPYTQMRAQSLHSVRHFTCVYLHAHPRIDECDMITWQTMVTDILITEEPLKNLNLAACQDKNGAGSGHQKE